jgi:hypothetical protein
VLIAMPESRPFQVVRESLVEELQRDFDLATYLVPAGATIADLGRALDHHQPRCLVVMDNPVLGLYRRYGETHPEAPPAVAVMISFLEELRSLRHTTGIAYEVPGVTAFVQLRSIIAAPVRRVAVLHRPRFSAFIDRQAALAAKEQIALVPVPVSADPAAAEIHQALQGVRASASVDALWVLNDNGLLKEARFVEEAWRPMLSQLGMPVVVGLPSLVSAEARFGDFAVVPDHEALGVQSAQLIYKLADGDWRADQHPVELPISTVTVANLRRLQHLRGLLPGADERVDRVVE